jgi:TonB family protein
MARIGKYFDIHPDRWLFPCSKRNPEEYVRQWVCYQLIHEYGYHKDNIKTELKLKIASKTGLADVAILDNTGKPRILIETKAKNQSINKDSIGQLQSYLAATQTAIYGMATNGSNIYCCLKPDNRDGFQQILDIPSYQELNRFVLGIRDEEATLVSGQTPQFGPLSQQGVFPAACVKPLTSVFTHVADTSQQPTQKKRQLPPIHWPRKQPHNSSGQDRAYLATPPSLADKFLQEMHTYTKNLLLNIGLGLAKVAISIGLFFAGLVILSVVLFIVALFVVKNSNNSLSNERSSVPNTENAKTQELVKEKKSQSKDRAKSQAEPIILGRHTPQENLPSAKDDFNANNRINSPGKEMSEANANTSPLADTEENTPSSGADTKAQILSKPQPTYTIEAKERGIEGVVALSIVLSSTGEVTDIRPYKTLPFGLTKQAIEAAQQIEFVPAKKNGRLVSTRLKVEYSFNLQ